MNFLIIEDEYPAAERLQSMLASLRPEMQVVQTLDSITTALQWLSRNPSPDLIFSDIQLSDGLSFEIYDRHVPPCPIIFTTAFDEYAIRAFKLSSIDYLLKPIKPKELEASLQKFEQLQATYSQQQEQEKLQQLLSVLEESTRRTYKQRFLVQLRQEWIPVSSAEIAYFFTTHEIVYLVTHGGQRYPVDFKLEELDLQLDPQEFFRLSRQYISSHRAIERIKPHNNGRLKLQLSPTAPELVIVSRERAKKLRTWLDA